MAMIQEFVNRWMAQQEIARAKFAARHPDNYEEIVKTVIEVVSTDLYDDPAPNRIHLIDDGDYQGTLVFVIGAKGYQPSDYWYVKVSYGSCSGCDTLESIKDYSDAPPTENQVNDYMTLALHIVQGLRKMDD